MALFKKEKKNKEEKEVKTSKKESNKGVIVKESKNDYSWVIKKPRITEKAAIVAGDKNAYTFLVHDNATKTQIKEAIKLVYKVNPVKVNVVTIQTKKVRRKGRLGTKGGGRKAYVYLKKGDKIEFV